MKLYRIYQGTIILLIILIGVSFYDTNIENPDNHISYSSFTIELNCTLPPTPTTLKIISVGEGAITQEELIQLAKEIFHMDNPEITREKNSIILRQDQKTLQYHPTDFIRFNDGSIEGEKQVPINRTQLKETADEFLNLLGEYWLLPEGDEIRFSHFEFHDQNTTIDGKVSVQPQYLVYYHYINDTQVVALNAEFNLGFADGRIVSADISRINQNDAETVEITKTPIDAIFEAFPEAMFPSGKGVSSLGVIPVKGDIFIENFRVVYYNWHHPHSGILGEAYDLCPYYLFDAVLVGPSIAGETVILRTNREICAIH
jgi:hypothetical protein